MVSIKELCEKVSFDVMTVRSVLNSFFEEVGTQYRDSRPIDYLLNNRSDYFNYNGSVQKFEENYYEDKFHPIVKAYIDELVDSLVDYAKNCGAKLYKPFWEDPYYYESNVRTGSRLNQELIEFCNITNASDEVLTAIFNIALKKLTELGIAWGSIDAIPGLCSDEPYYCSSSQWVFQSYEEFKRIMAKEIYLEGESILGEDGCDEYKEHITENDVEIVISNNFSCDKVSGAMRGYLRELVAAAEWIGNEKLTAYAVKFKLELAGFGPGHEDDYLEIIAKEFINESKQYEGKDFIETCRFLMHETKIGNDYCYIKYEKRFDDLSESEKEATMRKVVNECIFWLQHN